MVKRRTILLYPLSLIYGFITCLRNFLYNSKVLHSYKFNLPVISVGNITVGGTGKTPHTEYIVGLLKDDFKVATLSRGYKRKTSGFRIATPESDVKTIGDEPLQIFRKFPGITVAVDTDRVHGVRSILMERPDTAVIILDDAFQHRKIKPGMSILLTDFNRSMANDNLLPYGNLRENVSNTSRANIIIVTKTPEDISPARKQIVLKELVKAPSQELFFTSLKYLDPVPVFINKASDTMTDRKGWKQISILLVTGIANPMPFKEYLLKNFMEVVHLDFHDHHMYSVNDISRIDSAWKDMKNPLKYIITSEKDAVRLKELDDIDKLLSPAFYYIPIGICFLDEGKEKFDQLIFEYVRKNK